MAAISLALQPASARRRQAAFRSPCAEQPDSPAASQQRLNHFVNAIGSNGFSSSVVRNVRCLAGVAPNAAARAGGTGIASVAGLLVPDRGRATATGLRPKP